jgi:hypothetical protein
MSSLSGFSFRSVVLAAAVSCFLAPSGFAQMSSSARTHADFDSVVQDQYPNQGGYNRGGYSRGYGNHHAADLTDHLAIEVGAGFNVPSGNTTTWQAVGYSINLGGGCFTQPVYVGDYCDYFYGCYPQYENVTLSHFSSNQGGANIGTGITFRPNPDGKGKFFAEARYVWVDSPASSNSAVGTGTVNMFPVTFGYRW